MNELTTDEETAERRAIAEAIASYLGPPNTWRFWHMAAVRVQSNLRKFHAERNVK